MKYIKSFLILAIAILGFSSFDAQAQSYTPPAAASQQTIEKKVFKEILRLPYYGVFDHIGFTVDGGTVTLYGKVNNGINRSSAERVVKRIPGVDRVVNRIDILPPSSFDDSIRYRTARAFQSTAGALYRYLQEPNPSVRIIVENGHVTLEGYVANRGDLNLMNILANSVSGVFSVQNNLLVEKEINR
jgi:hyperosmotically inducible protein